MSIKTMLFTGKTEPETSVDTYSETVLDEQVTTYLGTNVERLGNIKENVMYEKAMRERRVWGQLLEISKVNFANSSKAVEKYDRAINAHLMGEVGIWTQITDEFTKTKFGKLSLAAIALALFVLLQGFFAIANTGDTVQEVASDTGTVAVQEQEVPKE